MKHMLLIFHTVAGTSVSHATVARTPSARARGLRGWAGLTPNESMLFAWPSPVIESFTMKGVPFPLDLALLDQSGTVNGIVLNMKPYVGGAMPHIPFQYAIELPAGFLARHRVAVGTPVRCLSQN
jgi:uncharacterized membrane protein (UPF0127 family)